MLVLYGSVRLLGTLLYPYILMIKAKQMGKTLRQEQTERTASKLGKKKPKYQAIIKVLKTQIEELQR